MPEYPCKRYGERWKDYPECGPCPEDICMACSLLTLEKMHFRRPVDVVLPNGRRVSISKGGAASR